MISCGQETRRRIVWRAGLALVVLGLASAAAACGGGGTASEGPAATKAQSQPAEAAAEPQAPETAAAEEAGPQPGGVYRIGVESSFNFSGGFDPTGGYVSSGWMIYGNLLLRTLLG